MLTTLRHKLHKRPTHPPLIPRLGMNPLVIPLKSTGSSPKRATPRTPSAPGVVYSAPVPQNRRARRLSLAANLRRRCHRLGYRLDGTRFPRNTLRRDRRGEDPSEHRRNFYRGRQQASKPHGRRGAGTSSYTESEEQRPCHPFRHRPLPLPPLRHRCLLLLRRQLAYCLSGKPRGGSASRTWTNTK